jgi:predicted nicotinamide N-methyase
VTAPTAPEAADFVGTHTRIAAPPHLPELRLHLAAEVIPLWERTERAVRGEMPPPFWAFAWAGGQALARHLLDNPGLVRGRRVLDLAAGCGLVAIAAARAGAAEVTANEIDGYAVAAIALNARANAVPVLVRSGDLLSGDTDAEVVLAGDVFYSREMAARVLDFLERASAHGAEVLVGDPGRAYLPRERFTVASVQDVPVIRDLEDAEVKRTTVWRLDRRPAAGGGDRRSAQSTKASVQS